MTHNLSYNSTGSCPFRSWTERSPRFQRSSAMLLPTPGMTRNSFKTAARSVVTILTHCLREGQDIAVAVLDRELLRSIKSGVHLLHNSDLILQDRVELFDAFDINIKRQCAPDFFLLDCIVRLTSSTMMLGVSFFNVIVMSITSLYVNIFTDPFDEG